MGSSLSQTATVQEVKAAVEALGSAYVKYGTAVADNGINGAMLRDITGEEIGDLGVTSLPKRRMLSEIEIFKATNTQAQFVDKHRTTSESTRKVPLSARC